jgi:hypothetical protein
VTEEQRDALKLLRLRCTDRRIDLMLLQVRPDGPRTKPGNNEAAGHTRNIAANKPAKLQRVLVASRRAFSQQARLLFSSENQFQREFGRHLN